ncbi:hypothetical protein GHK92_09450 [Nocardioides sp. dk4132]|uniref:hypothetical protein n=1 Tax=unclassified Nocardioides TaxID=2615069 RepID=UPI001294D8DE|nr:MULTISPECIES: hypothetical protein [unclassified Nocardioides]MQW76100.1 hypothetical protein [Nocardioides sp. dk4132]QGA08945.1 hypothetical protein GFH29_17205 [Nocardioides sp. dk884]
MSELSPEVPEDVVAEEVEPAEGPDSEEYLPDEDERVSPDTGTVYDPDGEPAETPQDLLVEETDEE